MPAEKLPSHSAIVSVVVRVVGAVPVRIDVTHLGSPEQQLGLSLGTVLIYMQSATTAEAVVDGWRNAAAVARLLGPAGNPNRLLPVMPSTVGTLVRLAGVPTVVAAHVPARGAEPAHLRLQVGPVTWQVCDWAAYESMADGWRRAAATLRAAEQ